jgi:hypothetical protein
MRFRILFWAITAFFITMNVLLWRSEFSGRGRLGTPVPADLVWDKVLTSPDNSFLEIRHRGTRIGRAHWVATVGELQAVEKTLSEEELPPEGMVRNLAGYTLDFDGNVSLPDFPRLRFAVTLKLDTNQAWQEFNLKIAARPFSWEIHASAKAERIRLLTDDDEGKKERAYSFNELRNPERLLRDVGATGLPAFFAALGFPLQQTNRTSAPLGLGLEWHAHEERLRIGSNDIRVYRLETRLLNHFKAVLFVSRVGEVLRVELPDEVLLINELTAL